MLVAGRYLNYPRAFCYDCRGWSHSNCASYCAILLLYMAHRPGCIVLGQFFDRVNVA